MYTPSIDSKMRALTRNIRYEVHAAEDCRVESGVRWIKIEAVRNSQRRFGFMNLQELESALARERHHRTGLPVFEVRRDTAGVAWVRPM